VVAVRTTYVPVQMQPTESKSQLFRAPVRTPLGDRLDSTSINSILSVFKVFSCHFTTSNQFLNLIYILNVKVMFQTLHTSSESSSENFIDLESRDSLMLQRDAMGYIKSTHLTNLSLMSSAFRGVNSMTAGFRITLGRLVQAK